MTHDAFRDAIMSHPEDALHCLAYADFLEEDGQDDLAMTFRWMARTGRRPAQRLRYKDGRSVPRVYGWAWVRESRALTFRNADRERQSRNPVIPLTAELPVWLLAEQTFAPHVYFSTWSDAIAWLCESLKVIRKGMKT